MGIGSHLSERRLIDELGRMGMNESIVRVKCLKLMNEYIQTASLNLLQRDRKSKMWTKFEKSPLRTNKPKFLAY